MTDFKEGGGLFASTPPLSENSPKKQIMNRVKKIPSHVILIEKKSDKENSNEENSNKESSDKKRSDEKN